MNGPLALPRSNRSVALDPVSLSAESAATLLCTFSSVAEEWLNRSHSDPEVSSIYNLSHLLPRMFELLVGRVW